MNLGVIFDIDGTLVDNLAYHEEAWIEWSRRKGNPVDRAFYREKLFGRTNDEIFRTLYGDSLPPSESERLAAEKEALYRELYAPVMQAMPGLLDLLRDLQRAGVPCAAASNAERVNVDFIIDGLKIRDFFRAVLSREDVVRGKPDPELFLLAARRMGVPPARCVVFEDSRAGFEAAARAGMRVIAVIGSMRYADPPADALQVIRDYRGLTADRLRALVDDPAATELSGSRNT